MSRGGSHSQKGVEWGGVDLPPVSPPALRAGPEQLVPRAQGRPAERGARPRDPTSLPLRKKELKAYVKRFANRSPEQRLDELSVKESEPYGLQVPGVACMV